MMKKILLLVSAVLMSLAVSGQKKGPFSYPYYISGVTEIDPNDGDITLTNIKYKGFECSEVLKMGINNEKAEFLFKETLLSTKSCGQLVKS